jgi:hypothetical protein
MSLTPKKKEEIANNTYRILERTKSYDIKFNNNKNPIDEISIITHNQSINLNDTDLNKFFNFLDTTDLYRIDPINNQIILHQDNFKILNYTNKDDTRFGYVLYLTETEHKTFTSKLKDLYTDMSKINTDAGKTIESIKYPFLGELFNPEILYPTQKSINSIYSTSVSEKITINTI